MDVGRWPLSGAELGVVVDVDFWKNQYQITVPHCSPKELTPARSRADIDDCGCWLRPCRFTEPENKDREQRPKKDHNIVKSIMSKSGFGWNPEIKMAIAIDEKWKSCLKNNRSGEL